MPRAAVQGRPDTIHDLIYPSHGYRDQLKRQGIKPHDHGRDNRRYIKELQAKIAERKLMSAAEADAAATTPGRKFMRVASRVASDLSTPRPASAPSARRQSAPAQRNFYAGKPHQPSQQVTRTGKTAAWVEPPLLVDDPTVPASARRAPVPPRGVNENMPTQASPTTDYVAKNIAAAAQQRQASARSATREQRALAPRSAPLGKLPAYLIDRKLELARILAEEAANALPPGVPPNHHVLPKEDCLRVLDEIRKARVEVEKELDCFPFVVDTPTQKARHAQLTKELTQLEAAEKAFSRKKVVVADGTSYP